MNEDRVAALGAASVCAGGGLLCLLAAPAAAAPPGRRAHPRRRGEHPAPQPGAGRLLRPERPRLPARRARGDGPGAAVRPLDLHRRGQAPRPPLDGRDLGADLRDLQGLPAPAGQVPPAPGALHRRDHRGLFRPDRLPGLPHRDRAALQPDRHGRQLRRGLVRHPHQHAGQLAHGLRQPGRQGVPGLRDPPARGHERGDDADLGRAGLHARHPALHPRRIRGRLLPGLRHRGVARRLRAAHRRRHLHEDRGHRLRPDEDRLQDQGGRRAQPRRDRGLRGRQRGRLRGPHRGRVRDLRRHGRGADLLHHAGRLRPARAGAAPGLDLRDARDDGDRLGPGLPGQRGPDPAPATRSPRPCTSRRRSPSSCG